MKWRLDNLVPQWSGNNRYKNWPPKRPGVGSGSHHIVLCSELVQRIPFCFRSGWWKFLERLSKTSKKAREVQLETHLQIMQWIYTVKERLNPLANLSLFRKKIECFCCCFFRFCFCFCGTGVWTQDQVCTVPLEPLSQPNFCFNYFSGRGLHFCLGPSSDCDPPYLQLPV
jgi:hypothetical protein